MRHTDPVRPTGRRPTEIHRARAVLGTRRDRCRLARSGQRVSGADPPTDATALLASVWRGHRRRARVCPRLSLDRASKVQPAASVVGPRCAPATHTPAPRRVGRTWLRLRRRALRAGGNLRRDRGAIPGALPRADIRLVVRQHCGHGAADPRGRSVGAAAR